MKALALAPILALATCLAAPPAEAGHGRHEGRGHRYSREDRDHRYRSYRPYRSHRSHRHYRYYAPRYNYVPDYYGYYGYGYGYGYGYYPPPPPRYCPPRRGRLGIHLHF